MGNLSEQTNFYLFHAKSLIGLKEQQDNEKDKRQIASLEVAIKLCLKQSLSAWLEEIADHLQIDGAEVSWSQFLNMTQSEFPDLQHLINLKQQPNTWLYSLMMYVDDKRQFGQAKPQVVSPSQSIQLVSVEKEADPVATILADFKEYVQQVRSHQVEW